MSQAIRLRVLEMSETESKTILGATSLLKRVVKTSCFAASVGKVESHYFVKSSVCMTAANGVGREEREVVKCWPRKKRRKGDEGATAA